jgi:hypothetical protein
MAGVPLLRLISFEEPKAPVAEPPDPPPSPRPPAPFATPDWCRWWADQFDADAQSWRGRAPRRPKPGRS